MKVSIDNGSVCYPLSLRDDEWICGVWDNICDELSIIIS